MYFSIPLEGGLHESTHTIWYHFAQDLLWYGTRLLFLLGYTACTRSPDSPAPFLQTPYALATISSNIQSSSFPTRITGPSPSGVPPLSASAPFIEIAVADHRPAVVSIPLGATTRRPVLVATHGAGDKPEWHCQLWRGIIENNAFVLCPRGHPLSTLTPVADTLYYYPNHFALAREVHASLKALRIQFADYVDTTSVVYAGFSQGASMGTPVLALEPGQFPRAILIEGGYEYWNLHAAQTYQRAGGLRVLFACGQPHCLRASKAAASLLTKAGLDERVVYGEHAGHSYLGAVETEVRKAFSWVVEGDPRWGNPIELLGKAAKCSKTIT